MNLTPVLQKAWKMLWQYRALWLLGPFLALFAANTIYLGSWPDRERDVEWIKVKIGDYSTIRLPGAWGTTVADRLDCHRPAAGSKGGTP